MNLRLPHSKSFYSNDVFNKMKHVTDFKIGDYYYYFEIDKNFDLYIYKYDVNSEYRPIPIKNLMSDAELLLAKSKTCAGIPHYKSGKITHSDYLDVIQHNRKYLNKIKYQVIKNSNGVTKTVTTKKRH